MRHSLAKAGTRINGIGSPCPVCCNKLSLVWSPKRHALFWGCDNFPTCDGAMDLYGNGAASRLMEQYSVAGAHLAREQASAAEVARHQAKYGQTKLGRKAAL